jgi:phosphohistidine phosphatase
MKTLLFVRHAKSSRDDPSLPDRDRPLDDQGKQDAP